MNKIELFPLQNEHCRQVEDIAKQTLPEHWSLEGIRDILRYENNIYYVAYSTERKQIIGFAGIMVIVDEAELLNIAVYPEFQGQGIGKLLLEKLLQEAVIHGAYRMLLEVRESNLSARNMYNSYRFVKIAERKNYYSNPVENAIIMERRLSEMSVEKIEM